MNSSQIAFSPLGQTKLITADALAPTGIQVPVQSSVLNQSVGQYRFINAGLEVAYIGYGQTAAIAQTNAAGFSGGVTNAFILMPGAVEILRFAPDTYFSAYAANPCSIYVVPGQGL